jgi:hypothetical protein
MKRNQDRLLSVQTQLAGFSERARVIRENPDLSGAGREKRLQLLQAEIDAYRSIAYTNLEIESKQIRVDYAAWQGKHRQAAEAAAASWDFNRLQYERSAAISTLKTADDFEAARAAYESAVSGADRHKARAFLESAPETLQARFGGDHGMEVNRVAKDASVRLPALIATTELAAAAADHEDVTVQALTAKAVIDQAALFWDPGAANPGSTANEFSHLSKGFKVDSKWEEVGSQVGYRTTVQIIDPGPLPDRTETYQDRMGRLVG